MSGIDASRLAEELNALLEQGRIVTWLDRNGEYADDLDAVQDLLDGATLITINANLFETKLRIFAETPSPATFSTAEGSSRPSKKTSSPTYDADIPRSRPTPLPSSCVNSASTPPWPQSRRIRPLLQLHRPRCRPQEAPRHHQRRR